MKHSAQILGFLFLTLFGCKNSESENKIADTEFEQKVFEQVFINIVDSTYADKRIYTRIPTKNQENDSNFIAETKAIEKDTLNLVIAVDRRYDEIKKLKNKKFIFKNLKDIPVLENYTNWTEKFNKFIGVMSFSNITFDKAKENGKLNVSYSCGTKCGLGYKVYLTKKNRKWKVIKTENTWKS